MTDYKHENRAIRSFVRRSGRLTPGQKSAFSNYWDQYGIDYRKQKIEISELKAGCSEFKLEIGIGNGDALIDMAEKDPASFYIGIEVHQPGIGRCLNEISSRSLPNIRLISHDAVEVMQHMLTDCSLHRIFLFFPDPWHKKRHKKRRIVNQQFRDLAYRLLKSGGCIHLATDWQDYAEYMSSEFLADQRYINCGNSEGFSARPEYRPETHFERRGLKLGHGVWDLLFEKG